MDRAILCTGKNIKYQHDNNTATWESKILHVFVSTQCFNAESMPILLKYKGSGHFYCGLSSDDGKYVEECRFLTKVKSEHGKIGFENREQEVVITMDNKIRIKKKWSEIHGDSIHLCFSLKFGDIRIRFADRENENSFVSLSQLGKVKEKSIKLKTSEPDCEVACNRPLSVSTYIQMDISSVNNANWWKIQMFLSNTEPSAQLSMPSDKLQIPFNQKNPTGVITLMESNGRVTYTYRDSKETIDMKQLHLSQKVYLWLIVFRCQVQVTLLNKENYEKIVAYVKVETEKKAHHLPYTNYVTPMQVTDDNEHTVPKELDIHGPSLLVRHHTPQQEASMREAEKEFKNLEKTLELIKQLLEMNPEVMSSKWCQTFHKQLIDFRNKYDYDSEKLDVLRGKSEQLFSCGL